MYGVAAIVILQLGQLRMRLETVLVGRRVERTAAIGGCREVPLMGSHTFSSDSTICTVQDVSQALAVAIYGVEAHLCPPGTQRGWRTWAGHPSWRGSTFNREEVLIRWIFSFLWKTGNSVSSVTRFRIRTRFYDRMFRQTQECRAMSCSPGSPDLCNAQNECNQSRTHISPELQNF